MLSDTKGKGRPWLKQPKTVQIDFELFCNLCNYFLRGDEDVANDIEVALRYKVDKIIAHQLYSKYKTTSPTDAEREEWRQAYLNHIGMHKDWRTDTEQPEELPPDE